MTTRRRVLAAASIVAAGLTATACGSEGITLKGGDSASVKRGAALFSQRCSGCHTMDIAGAQGGATRVHDRERPDGPNFNVRKETPDSVLYAIRNGGFSGAIMPENIVVGAQASDVAAFVSKYAGGSRKGNDITPQSQPAAAGSSQGGGGGGGAPSTGTTSTPEAQGTTSTPEAGTTSTPAAGTTSTGAGGTQQAAAQGKPLFTQNCAGCHTLKDANARGQIGPNLDDLKPDQPTTQRQVTNGGGGMPAFKGQLSADEINAVSQYVTSVAGK
jgi:mono/diheme cytochrome c family protein